MQGLHVHQIQSLTVLRVNQVSRPRIAYVIGDNGCYWQDSTAYPQSEALWHSYDSLGDGNFSAGDSSAPSFAWAARNLEYEAFLRFSSTPQPIRLINPKPGAFIADRFDSHSISISCSFALAERGNSRMRMS